jgi:hypothetical protein
MRKTLLSTPKVLLTHFEKATIAAVEYLYQNWHLHKKFRKRIELLNQLGIDINKWGSIKKEQRKIPETLWPKINDVLTKQFYVHPTFMHTNTGPMFKENTPWRVDEDPAPYGEEDLRTAYQLLKKKYDALLKENKDLRDKSKLQDKLITQLEAVAKPVAKKKK